MMERRNEEVILVDLSDNEIGTLEKMEAHRQGLLHRAFSVFLLNRHGEVLLQQRSLSKYHSAGLWSNTCCSHPRPGESIATAALRRLREEMGIEAALLTAGHFVYLAELDHGLSEHELDHVLVGFSDEIPRPDPAEVMDWKYIGLPQLENELAQFADQYTIWIGQALPLVQKFLYSSGTFAP